MVDLGKLGEHRNELVHSTYFDWRDVHGNHGLIRRNSKLSGSAGTREEKEEKLQPEAFNVDRELLLVTTNSLETHRRRAIEWRHPRLPVAEAAE